ncbi:Membrane protein [Phytophthora cinnamomi]|uniref:Membrane protein n=1 Tax=Phytophthora cinnamomi TaxID=4785 RepID=UPI00355AA193|nr:Membrane protein [Phytophthora cinnamomi]KAG6614388.1 Membrane protein [Phytophthora cinnamomi]
MGFFNEQVGVKVPQVTIYFWIIKVLATTVGETFADFLNGNVGLGLGGTSGVMLVILLASLAAQMKLDFYFAPLYWFVIVAISTVGTLLSDNLTDNLNVPLSVTTPIFLALLVIVFCSWYRVERNLSIHSIFTRRREAWYWLAVLVTFALGTSAGDLIAEQLNVGYGNSLVLFAGCIVFVALLWWFKVVNGVFGFWAVYVLTRPLGASLGDLMSQNPADSVNTGSGSSSGSSSLSSSASASTAGSAAVQDLPSGWKAGLNLGTTVTSMIFLGLIAVLVIFLTITKKDTLKVEPVHADIEKGEHAEPTSTASVQHEFAMLPDNARR